MKTLKRNIGKVRHKVNFFPIFFSFTPFFYSTFPVSRRSQSVQQTFFALCDSYDYAKQKKNTRKKNYRLYIIIYKNYWCAFSIICHNFSIFTSRTNKRLNKPMFTLFLRKSTTPASYARNKTWSKYSVV